MSREIRLIIHFKRSFSDLRCVLKRERLCAQEMRPAQRRQVTGEDKAERNLATGGDAVIVRTLHTSNKKGKQLRKVPTPPVNQKLLPCRKPLIFWAGGVPSFQIVSDHLAALHHKFDSLELSDVLQWVSGNSDHVGEFTFLHRTDAIFPAHHLSINNGPSLDGRCGGHPMIDQPCKLHGLRPVIQGATGTRIAGGPVNAAANDYLHSPAERILKVFLKDWNDAVFSSCVLAIILHNFGHSVAESSYVKVKPLLHHHGGHLVIQALPVLDSVNASKNRVPKPFAAIRVGRHAMVMAMRLVYDRLQFSQRKRRFDVQLAGGTEGVSRSREHFNPIGAVTNLFADDFARLVRPVNFLIPSSDVDPWSSYIVRARCTDSSGRNLHSGAVE